MPQNRLNGLVIHTVLMKKSSAFDVNIGIQGHLVVSRFFILSH